MDSKVAKLMNDQVNKEFYSAYLYLDMSNFYNDKGLDGFAKWFEIQANEEMEHGMKIYHFLQDNDQKVELLPIAKPDKKFKEIADPLKIQVEHEEYVTSLIHNIYAVASKANDYRSVQFMDWYVAEQCQEEKEAKSILKKYELFASKGGMGLFHMDQELGSRE